jgi:hypothetical protein
LVVVGIGVRPNVAIAEQAGIATDNGVLVDEFLETNVPGIFAAGDIARWPDPRAGCIRVEHWVVAQRHGQTAARNILGAREPFNMPPFFWSNHCDLHIHYVGHGSGKDQAIVSGNLREKDASVVFRSVDKLAAVASVGRGLENLKAEVALERGEEFRAFKIIIRTPKRSAVVEMGQMGQRSPGRMQSELASARRDVLCALLARHGLSVTIRLLDFRSTAHVKKRKSSR